MRLIAIGAALFASSLSPSAMAASAPDTRLVSCGEESCLLVSGQRADAASEVRINGHAVPVEGRQTWKVRLPVDTVRAWSAPMARTIDVTVRDPGAPAETTKRADLPIGLLGHVTELASLVIGA
jgi:hypothetical protein